MAGSSSGRWSSRRCRPAASSPPCWTRSPQLLADAAREGAGGGRGARCRRRSRAARWRDSTAASELVMAAREAAQGNVNPAAAAGHAGARPGGGAVRLTHIDEQGAARMVDVGGKPVTARERRGRGPGADVGGGVRARAGQRGRQGRRAGGGAGGRHQGAKRTAGAGAALPPARAGRGGGGRGSGPGVARRPDHGADSGDRAHRRGNGGAGRRHGRLPHRVRHGEGGRSQHAIEGVRLLSKTGGTRGD